MANKDFTLEEGLLVTVYKRKSSRHLRLSVAASGQIRVTIPAWAPYRAGIEFARSRQQWIQAQQKPINLLVDGQAIGKAHHLSFQAQAESTRVSTRVLATTILIRYPDSMSDLAPEVQKAAKEACVRALRAQAEQLLPRRLETLAANHDFSYGSVQIKRLKGRWGSCDHKAHIVLNLFLMQLPWELIDYVLLHELVHTEVLRHGPDFWSVMNRVLPAAPDLRKRLRAHHPVLDSPTQELMA